VTEAGLEVIVGRAAGELADGVGQGGAEALDGQGVGAGARNAREEGAGEEDAGGLGGGGAVGGGEGLDVAAGGRFHVDLDVEVAVFEVGAEGDGVELSKERGEVEAGEDVQKGRADLADDFALGGEEGREVGRKLQVAEDGGEAVVDVEGVVLAEDVEAGAVGIGEGEEALGGVGREVGGVVGGPAGIGEGGEEGVGGIGVVEGEADAEDRGEMCGIEEDGEAGLRIGILQDVQGSGNGESVEQGCREVFFDDGGAGADVDDGDDVGRGLGPGDFEAVGKVEGVDVGVVVGFFFGGFIGRSEGLFRFGVVGGVGGLGVIGLAEGEVVGEGVAEGGDEGVGVEVGAGLEEGRAVGGEEDEGGVALDAVDLGELAVAADGACG